MSFEFLSNLWFFLLALVWGIYIAQEMFISGVGMISSRFVKDEKKFSFLNRSVGTHWDGVQVWLILAVGGTFAAFPTAYASIFTNLYVPIFLLLDIIIIRGISIEVIDKTNSPKMKKLLKWAWIISSALLLIVLAVYSANIFIGLPIQANGSMNDTFLSFLTIFNMVAIVTAIMFIIYSLSLGALYIKLNGIEEVSNRLKSLLKIGPLVATLLLVLVYVGLNAKGDAFNHGVFVDYLWLWALPIISVLSSFIGAICSYIGKYIPAFILMIIAILLFMITGYISLMPNFIYSTVDPSYSMTIAQGSANVSTLQVMFISTLIFLPIVIGYQAFKYIKFWRK